MADESHPTPLIDAFVDLRSFSFMPLDVVRLRESGMAADTDFEAFRAAVMLWCAAWHQVPAGSLPNNLKALAHLAGYGWQCERYATVSANALRGFVLCSDGRLYHPLICEKAREAYAKKLSGKRGAKERWRRKKSLKPNGNNNHAEAMRTQCEGNAIERTGEDRISSSSKGDAENLLMRICEILRIDLHADVARFGWLRQTDEMLRDGLDPQKEIIPAAEIARKNGKLNLAYVRAVAFNLKKEKPNGTGNGHAEPKRSSHSKTLEGIALAAGMGNSEPEAGIPAHGENQREGFADQRPGYSASAGKPVSR